MWLAFLANGIIHQKWKNKKISISKEDSKMMKVLLILFCSLMICFKIEPSRKIKNIHKKTKGLNKNIMIMKEVKHTLRKVRKIRSHSLNMLKIKKSSY
jgi:hypothetical protein